MSVSTHESRRSGFNMTALVNLMLFMLLAVMWLGLAASTTTFLSTGNVTNLFRQSALLSIIAIGQTVVIITAGIDLSVGAMVGFSSVVVSLLLKAGYPVPVAVAATLATGGIVGFYHGVAIRRLGIPPFIITLSSLSVLTGIGLLLTRGSSISGLPPNFLAFSRNDALGVPNLSWMVVMVAVPVFVLLKRMTIGRYIFAVGSSPEAARLSGINVNRTIYFVYILSSTLAALTGILTTSRIAIGLATTGIGWELQSIAAAVIGGASLFGAIGGVVGSLLGAMALTTINNGANLLNVNPFWQQIITGLLIVVIVYLDQLRRAGR